MTSQLREIFNQLHVRIDQTREDDKTRVDSLVLSNICLEASQSYIKAIENELKILEESRDEETLQIKEDFQLHLKVWKLCQIIFIKSSPSGTLLNELQEWYRSTNNIDSIVQNLFRDYASSPNQMYLDQRYWPIILISVAQGRIDTARHLMSVHSLSKSSGAFKAVDEQLRTMPTFQSLGHLSMFEFRTKWEFWQKKCIQVLNNEDFSCDPTGNLETICNMLCAVEKAFLDMKDYFQSWYYMLISYVSYSNPTFNISDLHHHLSSRNCMRMFEDNLDEFDSIIYNIFDFDVESVISECTNLFSNNLFTAHLLDILYLNGKLQLNKQEFSSTVGVMSGGFGNGTGDNDVIPLGGSNQNADIVHEEHLVNYASQLIMSTRLSASPSLSIYETAFDYLLNCVNLERQKGIDIIEAYMEKIPLTYLSEVEANKLFQIAYKLGLEDIAYSIGRCMQMRAFKANNYGTALGWNVRIKDATFGNILAERLLEQFFKTGDADLLSLTDYLSKEIIYCDRLIFLSKYREYLNLTIHSRKQDENQKLADFKKAASLIVELLEERGLVPFQYKRRVIFDVDFLLKKAVFNEDQLVGLLRIIQAFENRLEYFYDGSYRKSFLKFRPELASNEFVDQADLNAISRQRGGGVYNHNNHMETEENENGDEDMAPTTGSDSCDNYNRGKWQEILADISQKLADEFVKKPIDLEP